MKSKISIEFILSGDEFDLLNISKELGINPTKEGKKGEKTPAPGNFFWKETFWVYSTGYRETWETSPLFMELIDLFEPKIPIIKSLIQTLHLSASVCFVISVEGTRTPIIFLDSHQISFLHELNATLDFDEYWSPDEDSEY
jgi:hypothetical protein